MAAGGLRLSRRPPDRQPQVATEQARQPARHVTPSRPEVFSVVRALPNAVAPAERQILLRPSPGTVVDDALRHIPDPAAGSQQPIPHIVVLTGREFGARSQLFVETPNLEHGRPKIGRASCRE